MTSQKTRSQDYEARDKFNAIEKACTILLSFLPANDPISTADLSRATDFHNATTSRILRLLADYGFVRQNESTKQYSLGNSIIQLAAAVSRSLESDLVSIARPYLVELRKNTGQTCVLEILNGHVTVMGCVVPGDITLGKMAGNVGETLPWNHIAGMRAIMAFADDKFQAEVMAQPMEPGAENAVSKPEDLKAALKKAKKNGYALVSGAITIGIDGLAVPIFGQSGQPIAAISLVGLTQEIRRKKKEFIPAIKKAAQNISEAMMFSGGK